MIIIRPMQQEDVDAVMEIDMVVEEVPWTPNIFSDCIKVGYGCWVLSEENKVIGYGLLSVSASEGHILKLAVKPSYYRQGLGTRMMKHLLNQAKRQAAESVYLEVRLSNQPAIELYHKLGFTQIGERKDYYPSKKDGREDALVLSISLV